MAIAVSRRGILFLLMIVVTMGFPSTGALADKNDQSVKLDDVDTVAVTIRDEALFGDMDDFPIETAPPLKASLPKNFSEENFTNDDYAYLRNLDEGVLGDE